MFRSDAPITAEEFRARAAAPGAHAFRARKTGYVAARPAIDGERVETRWNGVETVNHAHAGDMVATNLTPAKAPLRDDEGHVNTYVIRGARFRGLYARDDGATEHGAIHRSIVEVDVLATPDGFDILAPWGERQRAERGYLILNGDEVYGAHEDTFAATYEVLGGENLGGD